MEESAQNIDVKMIKSPELLIQLNHVPVNALIDTGSAVNALSEDWYNNHKRKMGNHEISVSYTHLDVYKRQTLQYIKF